MEETQRKNSYVKYGRYIEDCAKNLGWHELLNTLIYDPLRIVETKNRIINLQYKNVNDIVKVVAKTLPTMSLGPNDLILSGILDVPILKSEKSPIMKELKQAKLWKSVDEPIEFLSMPNGVEQFVIKCIETKKNHNIKIPKKNASLFVRIKNLVDSILWKNPEYQTPQPNINESTWGHNVLKPIVDFIDYDLESELLIR
ncbi:18_t:CDS:2, partial [Gigaspora rosea]